MSRADVPRYSRISSRFWTDEKSSAWIDRVKLAGLYLMSCPHRHLEGIFILPHQYACADLHWTTKTWKSACTVLEESGFLKWDSLTNVILIVNALRYQAPENPNQAFAALRRIKELPDTPLLQDFCRLALEHCTVNGATPAAQAFAQQLHQQLQERLGEQLAPLNLNLLSQSQPKTQSQSQPPRRAGEESVVRNVVSTKGRGVRTEENGELAKISSVLEEKWPHLRETADSKP